jgi:hypothetical protein
MSKKYHLKAVYENFEPKYKYLNGWKIYRRWFGIWIPVDTEESSYGKIFADHAYGIYDPQRAKERAIHFMDNYCQWIADRTRKHVNVPTIKKTVTCDCVTTMEKTSE